MNYKDIADKPEIERIREIANACRARPGKKIAFIVDADSTMPGKADRYMRKLRNLCPEIREVKRLAGPVENVTSIIVTVDPPPTVADAGAFTEGAR